jgi:hypothetical protein
MSHRMSRTLAQQPSFFHCCKKIFPWGHLILKKVLVEHKEGDNEFLQSCVSHDFEEDAAQGI